MINNDAKDFHILATSLDVLHNYFDSLLKLFLDLYQTKFLDISAKPFFLCGDTVDMVLLRRQILLS